MTIAAPSVANSPAPKKRGPNTPEGKARSAMNALKHGLRARTFGILPEEDRREWAQHVQDLRQGYGPVDAAEEKLVTAIAVAMWNEIRADRTLVETMAEIPPCAPGRGHGSALQEPRHAMSLNTAIRYMTAASMATQRAQRAFFQHRKAKRAGLILAAAAEDAEPPANQNGTNEFPSRPERTLAVLPAPADATVFAPDCTNEFPPADQPSRASGRPREVTRLPQPAPDPLAALHARIDRLLDGPGPRSADEWDLIAAIRALKLPGAAPYGGPIDPSLLARALDGLGFDTAGLAWLAALAPARPSPVATRWVATGLTLPGRAGIGRAPPCPG